MTSTRSRPLRRPPDLRRVIRRDLVGYRSTKAGLPSSRHLVFCIVFDREQRETVVGIVRIEPIGNLTEQKRDLRWIHPAMVGRRARSVRRACQAGR
jgi:aminoglycoside phosphotransferase